LNILFLVSPAEQKGEPKRNFFKNQLLLGKTIEVEGREGGT